MAARLELSGRVALADRGCGLALVDLRPMPVRYWSLLRRAIEG